MIDEALRETKRMVILGDPGTGKTTLLKYLTVICAEGRAVDELGLRRRDGRCPLPIFIFLREFAAESQSGSRTIRSWITPTPMRGST